MDDINKLTTEQRNQHSFDIDRKSTIDILRLINKEDQKVAEAVNGVLAQIAKVVDVLTYALSNEGRLLYVGAGTSGRIGILDAVECPPTFRTPDGMIEAVMAGGHGAIIKAVEGAEDSEELGANDLKAKKITNQDVVLGIAASGRTPYVIGALKYAQQLGAFTVSLTSNQNALISQYAKVPIEVITGPEVITGSTRLKAATAHKLILNMITTTTMIKLGKVYENLMVDLNVSNQKLIERAKNILSLITGASYETVGDVLELAHYEVKPAIMMIETGVSYEEAKLLLSKSNGFVQKAIDSSLNKGSEEHGHI